MSEPIDIPAKVAEGIALFNAGEYFEAHETWEEAWHATAGRTKATLQILIQLAVALEHQKRGNRIGANRMLRRAQRRLDALTTPEATLPDPHRLMSQVHGFIASGRSAVPNIAQT